MTGKMSFRFWTTRYCKNTSYKHFIVNLSTATSSSNVSSVKSTKRKYADSLNLPQMPYALSVFKPDGRCNERENYIKKITDFEGLYEWQQENNVKSAFTIHDGPPYANGNPHVGHALNKIIKDVINRYKLLRGHKVNFVPGWDCHGLPIETKARAADDFSLSDIQVRKQAEKFSRETLNMQREEFKQWGVMADWGRPYVTSDTHFVQHELEIFQQLYDKGLVYEDYMPVYWSPTSRTALAEAELEYNANHVSLSVYVKLQLNSVPDHMRRLVADGQAVNLVIWTTTPWTLPANHAVCYSTSLQYSLVHCAGKNEYLIVASDLVDQLAQKLNSTFNVLSTFNGDLLSALTYEHPIYSDRQCPLLPASHVTADAGTGLVHTAPAHGHDDFKVALKYGLSKKCMVDERGRYTKEAGKLFEGKHVFDEGNRTVIDILGARTMFSEDFTHKYPYDWRSKKPVLIRASRQWFINTKNLIEPSLTALEDVDVYPPVYKAPLADTICQRPYWCISRQRAWGVPIPAFHDQHGNTHIHSAITDHVRKLIGEHGSHIWWETSDENLLPDSVRSQAGLGNDLKLVRSRDILDIWFDSGITWSSVLGSTQADLYIEGVDQIRGWFQSSLLTSVALNSRAPYKAIMIHGFAVDENGQKMSKSVGNVMSPADVIYGLEKKAKGGFGVDVLRWWAASKYSITNVEISQGIVNQCNNSMLLLRKRMRFVLGNLYDFKPDQSLVDYHELPPHDQYFLHLLYLYGEKVTQYYEANEMSSVLNELQLFMTRFSALYAALSKDRLYCFPKDSKDRRSAQTVLHHMLEILVKSFAPILPFFAEDCYVHRYGNQLNKDPHSALAISVFRNGWFSLDSKWNNPELARKFALVYELVEEAKTLIENKPLDSMEITFFTASQNEVYDLLQELLDGEEEDGDCGELSTHSTLCEVMQCANVTVAYDGGLKISDIDCDYTAHHASTDTKIYVKETSYKICDRCRRYTATQANEPCEMCLLNISDDWAS